MTAYAETKLRCLIREYEEQHNVTVAECPVLREIFEDVGKIYDWLDRMGPKIYPEARF